MYITWGCFCNDLPIHILGTHISADLGSGTEMDTGPLNEWGKNVRKQL